MKVLFVTGGVDCECKGTGEVDRLISVVSVDGGRTIGHVVVHERCPCVEAREATVERTVYDGSGDYAFRQKEGSVVPEGKD